jgi:hypothetical protein
VLNKKRMRWKDVTDMMEIRNSYTILDREPQGKMHGRKRSIIVKLTLKKLAVMM